MPGPGLDPKLGARLGPNLGIVVGLEAEARLVRRLGAGIEIGISAATASGAEQAALALLERGARRLLSFGLAAGLDPMLRAGDLLVPARVVTTERCFDTDPGLRNLLGPGLDTPLLQSDTLVREPGVKAALFARFGCASLDMESGIVARVAAGAGIPFAVLRAVCDAADHALPPAACIGLRSDGRLQAMAVAGSILRHPRQLPALLALGRDANRAKIALADRLHGIASALTMM